MVFGVGDPHADLLFVGEGPGEQEDLTGEPFVGRAGRLLTSLIDDIGLTREQVYIANVVKCRPPGNRDPLPLEIETCRPYLEAQLDFIDPRVVVTLGNFATKLLLATKEGITKLRGREFPFRDGAVLIPTLHPSAVLRNGGPALAQARADFVTIKRALAARRAHRDPRRAHALGRGDACAGAAASARCCGRVTWSCSKASSAPARPSSPRGSRSRSASTEPVVSPTFTIVREYDAPLPLVHVDVYRLDHLQELHDLGFDDLVGSDAVTVVEWGDQVSALLPADRLDVRLEPGDGDDDRVVTISCAGLSWASPAPRSPRCVDAAGGAGPEPGGA